MAKEKIKIELGDYVIDSITEYEGIVIAIIQYLNGCNKIGIQSKDRNKDTGLPVDSYWVDETTVTVKKKEKEKSIQREKGGLSFRSVDGVPQGGNRPF